MDNKELDEVLQRYAESTRNDKDVAFKKLNEMPKEDYRPKKILKPRYIFASAICAIVIVLCIVLPITLTTDETPHDNGPRYCQSIDIVYNQENSLSGLIEGAYCPTNVIDGMSIMSITSSTDSTLHGARLSFYIFEEVIVDINFAIVPKTHILQTYENYFNLPNQEQWEEYIIKFNKSFNAEIETYDMCIYFADSKYDYFISASSDEELGASELLNMLYA